MANRPGPEELAIILIDNQTGQPLVLPVRPIDDQTLYTDGDQQPKAVTILDVGPVEIPGTETDLDSIAWGSFFPGVHDPSLCDVPAGQLLTPEQYRNRFSTWKDSGASLQLVWPWAFLNKTVYIKSFAWQPPNAVGDIFYTVAFRELKTITPKQVSTSADEFYTGQGPEDRQAVPEDGAPNTYTVQAGDTLTTIAKQYNLVTWREKVYEPNKDLIGPNPNRIIPGQVLLL